MRITWKDVFNTSRKHWGTVCLVSELNGFSSDINDSLKRLDEFIKTTIEQ